MWQVVLTNEFDASGFLVYRATKTSSILHFFWNIFYVKREICFLAFSQTTPLFIQRMLETGGLSHLMEYKLDQTCVKFNFAEKNILAVKYHRNTTLPQGGRHTIG